MPSIAARAALLLVASLSTKASHAQAPPPRPFTASPPSTLWHGEWPTFSRAEGIATVAAGIGTGVLFVLKPPSDPRWEGGILFDDAVRRGLRLESAHARQKVRAWGDLPYYAAPAIPLIIDPVFVALLGRGDAKTAFNLEAVGLEAFSYAGLMSYVSTRASVRERPDSSECRRTHDEPKACGEPDTESFYSGHTTIAAASAGIVCANHRAMPLWGHPLADAGACVLATTGAVASGVSRLAADRHYATDVLLGFGMGFGFGYGVPTLLHYARSDSDIAFSLVPGPRCAGACLSVAGTF
jgi:membrane-associated phospholipid phosphatase